MSMELGRITSSDLLLFLNLFPRFEEEFEGLRDQFRINPEKLIVPGSIKPSWYEFYEMTYLEHLAHIVVYTGQLEDIKALATAENPYKEVLGKATLELSSIHEGGDSFDEEERPFVPLVFGMTVSLFFALKSLLVYGVYLNDLVALAGRGDKMGDKALFQAIKVDPSVIACTNVINRLSLALIQNDQSFLKKLKRAVSGTLTKREHRVYQMQRLVLQILLEVKAPKLSESDLYELFVNQLKIASRDNTSDIGDVANNLRQFAYQFMKQKSVRQND